MRRILVVDDDPHMRLAVQGWLKRFGFRVVIADGGVTASLPSTIRRST
jgi:CheY-like chemotaxis protein